ncbi:hypothetical protein H9L39_05612 [Fusarium oxysporum f. sp. albedinis]|nr:hypothetical protein H9L39_05612 [Fusarium oxysporum f. sp. albedinis]WKT41704.1 hypothetical protein QSH57_006510 [Fusarium oxysporum f. sp. vasinfectum]
MPSIVSQTERQKSRTGFVDHPQPPYYTGSSWRLMGLAPRYHIHIHFTVGPYHIMKDIIDLQYPMDDLQDHQQVPP